MENLLIGPAFDYQHLFVFLSTFIYLLSILFKINITLDVIHLYYTFITLLITINFVACKFTFCLPYSVSRVYKTSFIIQFSYKTNNITILLLLLMLMLCDLCTSSRLSSDLWPNRDKDHRTREHTGHERDGLCVMLVYAAVVVTARWGATRMWKCCARTISDRQADRKIRKIYKKRKSR